MKYKEIVERLHSKNPKYHTYVIDAFRTTKFLKENGCCVIECINVDNKALTEEDIEFGNGSPLPYGNCEMELVIQLIPDDYGDFFVDGKLNERATIINVINM